MLKYDKLFQMLEDKGHKKVWLRQNGINPKVVDALVKNKNINGSTINKLCNLLDCQPADIMEYVSDNEEQ